MKVKLLDPKFKMVFPVEYFVLTAHYSLPLHHCYAVAARGAGEVAVTAQATTVADLTALGHDPLFGHAHLGHDPLEVGEVPHPHHDRHVLDSRPVRDAPVRGQALTWKKKYKCTSNR